MFSVNSFVIMSDIVVLIDKILKLFGGFTLNSFDRP